MHDCVLVRWVLTGGLVLGTPIPTLEPARALAQQFDFTSRAGALAAASSDAAEIDRRIAAELTRIERLEAERARAEAEVQALAQTRAATHRRVRDRIRVLYRWTRAGRLPLAGGLSALLAHAGRRARLERIVRADLDALSDVRARVNVLRAEAAERAAAIEEARQRLNALEAEKTGRTRVWSRGAAPSSGPLAGLSASSVVGASELGLRLSDPGPAAPPAAFEGQRGQLMIPVLAPTGMREASREEGEGLEISAAMGTTVRAAADGRVAFAHTHASYGRLVILDHGGSYFTVYGGLGRIDVAVGQAVPRGASLGTLDEGALFFQVRRGTRALAARAWLGI